MISWMTIPVMSIRTSILVTSIQKNLMNNPLLRKCEIMGVEGDWNESPMSEIKLGDFFRLYEADGTRVMMSEGRIEFRAKSNAMLDIATGTYGVAVDL